MYLAPIQYLAQARLADLHRQAQRDALARAARGSRRQQQSTHRARELAAAAGEQMTEAQALLGLSELALASDDPRRGDWLSWARRSRHA